MFRTLLTLTALLSVTAPGSAQGTPTASTSGQLEWRRRRRRRRSPIEAV